MHEFSPDPFIHHWRCRPRLAVSNPSRRQVTRLDSPGCRLSLSASAAKQHPCGSPLHAQCPSILEIKLSESQCGAGPEIQLGILDAYGEALYSIAECEPNSAVLFCNSRNHRPWIAQLDQRIALTQVPGTLDLDFQYKKRPTWLGRRASVQFTSSSSLLTSIKVMFAAALPIFALVACALAAPKPTGSVAPPPSFNM